MSVVDSPPPIAPDHPYKRHRHHSRGVHHYKQRRALRRRLTKGAFLAVLVTVSLLAAYLLAG